jgi:hypothetical protein
MLGSKAFIYLLDRFCGEFVVVVVGELDVCCVECPLVIWRVVVEGFPEHGFNFPFGLHVRIFGGPLF